MEWTFQIWNLKHTLLNRIESVRVSSPGVAFPFQWKVRWTYRTGCKNAETRAPCICVHLYVYRSIYFCYLGYYICLFFTFRNLQSFHQRIEMNFISRRWNVLMCQVCLWSNRQSCSKSRNVVFHTWRMVAVGSWKKMNWISLKNWAEFFFVEKIGDKRHQSLWWPPFPAWNSEENRKGRERFSRSDVHLPQFLFPVAHCFPAVMSACCVFPRLRIPDYNIYIVVHMYVFIFMNTSTLWMSCKNSSVVWNFHCSRKIL